MDYSVISFAGGYLSPRFKGRIDLPQYSQGCSTLENFLPQPQGSLTKVPGTYYVSAAKTAADEARIEEYRYTVAQSYILELGDEYMRFYNSSGAITCSLLTISAAVAPADWAAGSLVYVSGSATNYCYVQSKKSNTEYYVTDVNGTLSGTLTDGTNTATYSSIADSDQPLEITTPWDIDEVWDVQMAASEDEIYCVHPDYAPRKITRSASDRFTLTTPTISAYPWDDNPGDSGNYPSSVTFFQGRLFYAKGQQIWGSRTGDYDSFYTVSDVSVKSEGTADTNTEGYLELTTADFETDGVAAGDLVWNSTDSVWAKVEKVTSSTKLELDRDAFPDGNEAFVIYSTQINPTDAFIYAWSFEDGAEIKWLSGKEALVLGTEAGPMTLATESNILSPDQESFQYQRASAYACDDVQAIVANENILFPERGGKKLRQLIYSDEQKTYRTPDTMHYAQGIAGDGIKQMAFTLLPEPRIWCVTDDGDVIVFLLDSINQVFSWSKLTFDGDVESLAVMNTTGEDRVYFLIEREIDSSTVRYVEYLMPFDWGYDQEDVFFVRSGITTDGGTAQTIAAISKNASCEITFAAGHGFVDDDLIRIYDVTAMTEVNNHVYMLKNQSTNTFDLYTKDGGGQINSSGFTAAATDGEAIKVYETIDGLDHLEGESVAICADGAVLANETVSSGEITLDRESTVVHVGLGYTAKAITMPIPQLRHRLKNIQELWIELYQTLGLKVGYDADNLETIPFRATEAMGEPVPLFTGAKESPFDGGYEWDGDVCIVHDQPLPCTILSMWYKLGVY